MAAKVNMQHSVEGVTALSDSLEELNTKPVLAGKSGVVPFELSKPIKVDGKELTEITLDFDRLSGEDYANIELEMGADGYGNTVKMLGVSSVYGLYIATRAARMNIADVKRMSIKDTVRLNMETIRFFDS